jgi:hypothetical protein
MASKNLKVQYSEQQRVGPAGVTAERKQWLLLCCLQLGEPTCGVTNINCELKRGARGNP